MKRLIAGKAAAVVLLGAFFANILGCADQLQINELKDELSSSKKQLRLVSQEKTELSQKLRKQDEQISTLLGLGDKRIENLSYVKTIRLGRFTGGVDTDKKTGDDAIKVFLKPIDQQGHVIKAAGEVKIQLFDLAAEPADNLIAQYNWDAEGISKQWYSGFGVSHYSFICPWKSTAPQHDEITVRVEFTEYLTGNKFDQQKVCTIKP